MIYAQQQDSCAHKIQGVIQDIETKDALAYVKVQVEGSDKFAYTDEDGNFQISKLCHERNTLIISCFGYCDTVCEHFHEHNKSPHIFMKADVFALDEVVINVETKENEEGTESIAQETLEKEQLSSNPTQSLAEAISEVEGVTFISTGSNVQLPVIHGLYGNRILVLNNGIKHGFQNWGTDHAPEIDISTANKITIVKGAAGVRYGPEALGGVIIVEADPLYFNEPFHGKVGTGYQTNGKGYFVNSEIGQGLDKWSYHVGAKYAKIGDRHHPDYSLTNSGKEEKSINAGLRYNLKNWDFKAYYSYLDQDLALLRSSIAHSGTSIVRAINSDEPSFIRPFSYDINEPNQLTQHHLGKVEATWLYSDEAKLTFKIGKQLNKREEYDVRRSEEKPIIDLDLISSDYQLEWKHPEWFKLNGLIGLQAFTQDNDNNPGTGTTPFIPNYNTTRYSGFLIESLTKGKNTLEIGVRVDNEYNNVRGRETNQDIFRDEYSFTNLTSSVGYIREISDHTTFRTNIGTAWRTPNMSELYSFGQHGFKTTFGLLRYYTDTRNNNRLKTDKVATVSGSEVSPEKGYKWVNRLEKNHKKNNYTLTAYSHYIENFIYDRPLAVIGTIRGPMPVFIFDQANALFIGSDFTWKKDWTNSLKGVLGLSYLWSKNVSKNESLINQAPVNTNYSLSWETKRFWKFKSSKFTARPSYTFKQFQAPRTVMPQELIDGSVVVTEDSEIFDFKDAPEGYFLLNIAWKFEAHNLSGSLSVNNLLNTRYRDYLDETRYFAGGLGRNFLFTINYMFNSKSNKK